MTAKYPTSAPVGVPRPNAPKAQPANGGPITMVCTVDMSQELREALATIQALKPGELVVLPGGDSEELAALREELAECKTQKAWWADSAKTLDERLTAAEQRNAELVAALKRIYGASEWTSNAYHYQEEAQKLACAALKPTESGKANEQ